MATVFNPWQFTSLYLPGTPIRSAEVNPNFGGISASFTYVADELNQYIPRLPDNFTGNRAIDDGPYHNTLLGISPEGDMELVSRAAFSLLAGRDLTIVKTPSAAFTVNGDSHANFYYCENADETPGAVTAITVSEAIAVVEGEPAVAPGTVIFFTQVSDTPLVFLEAPGVTVKGSGLLKAFGAGSTVALVSIDQFTWVLVGDVYPGAVVVE